MIYIAGALFSLAEQTFNLELTEHLEFFDYDVFTPQIECEGLTSSKEIFEKCIEGLNDSDIIVAILEGTQVDDGTAWEVGRAYCQGKRIIGIRTDFRKNGDDKLTGLNCMISESCDIIITGESIRDIAKNIRAYIKGLEK